MKIVNYRALGILSAVALGTIGWLPLGLPTTQVEFDALRQASAEECNPARLVSAASSRDALKNVESTKKIESTPTSTAADPHETLKLKVDLLEKGRTFLKERADYTAMLEKQEVVKGRLMDEQQILVKCRHKPFSVYLEWHRGDVGREVIFVEGSNNGKMIAHDGGWKSRLPAFFLEPDCSLATGDARYPITEAGLLGLLENMLALHKEDLSKSTVATCNHVTDGQFDGRPCYVFHTTHKSVSISPTYRKSITCIDKEWSIPCCSQHYEWPRDDADTEDEDETDKETLIESYKFTEVRFEQSLTDNDFDTSNSEYHFH